MVVEWPPNYSHLVEPDATDKVRQKADEDAVPWLEHELVNENFNIYFWGNDAVDAAGHNYGFAPDVPEYIAEIERKDG